MDILSVDSGVAHFSYFGMDLPVASTVNRTQSDEWDGFVPVEELTEAIEVVTDVPV